MCFKGCKFKFIISLVGYILRKRQHTLVRIFSVVKVVICCPRLLVLDNCTGLVWGDLQNYYYVNVCKSTINRFPYICLVISLICSKVTKYISINVEV